MERKDMTSPIRTSVAVGITVGYSLAEKELNLASKRLQSLSLPADGPRNVCDSTCSRRKPGDLGSDMVTLNHLYPKSVVEDRSTAQAKTIGSETPVEKNVDGPERWIPPEIPPDHESIVDIKNEKPSGKNVISAWCCVVKIRNDHVICYAPLSGIHIHKVLVKTELLEYALRVDKAMKVVKLGNWIHLMCELRCKREYDDVRPPHFSHIATRICSMPQVKPPVEPWDQRLIFNLLQIFLHFDLSVPGNVRRISSKGEKYFVLHSTHRIPVLVSAKRLDHMVDTRLTAEKVISFWATRMKRFLECDMFLIDSEEIIEVYVYAIF